jgi:ubiquinone/menaquinone biosynthesis C-methylase UbiE
VVLEHAHQPSIEDQTMATAQQHPVEPNAPTRTSVLGAFNAWFFDTFDGYTNIIAGPSKRAAFGDIEPGRILEVGAGTGANFDHLPEGSDLLALEPNEAMHQRLLRRAGEKGIAVDLLTAPGEAIPLDDGSVDTVICSLVLCTVEQPAVVLSEIRRVLRPGGTFRFVEHVAASPRSPRRWLQLALTRPWAWVFEGCQLCRRTDLAIEAAGFTSVRIQRERLQRSVFVPVNTVISGRASPDAHLPDDRPSTTHPIADKPQTERNELHMTITDAQPTAPQSPSDEAIAAFGDKLFADLLGAFSSYATTIGVTLGWYEALAGSETMTSAELAAATETDERYAREWLEQQTVSGYLDVADPTRSFADRRYSISPEAAEVLTNRSSLAYMAAFPGYVTTLGRSLDQIIEAYRTGAGYGWHDHGDGARCGQAEANRPMFLSQLGPDYIGSIPEVEAALRAGGRVADVGCGLGWSSIGLATAFPQATVDGYDIDAPSIDQARINAAEAGVADRLQFHTKDVGQVDAGGYDLVLAAECVHDMADPVSVLAAMKRMAGSTGTVLVMDERVGEHFTGEPDPIEQLIYGFSLICCLPDGRNAPTSAATGAVMRPPTLASYATEAGFAGVEILPLENDFFRFYRLTR